MSNNALLSVDRPARYMGGEMGSVQVADADLTLVLAFPDVYEVGMSHLGFQILYGVLKTAPWIAPERAYAPWPDMERMLRDTGQPLCTLESGTPLAAAHIVGFTLQYELSYTNIINMLDLAGIPLKAAERDEGYPLILGGGPGAYNPEPLADFFDAFLLGDGEEAIVEIAAAVRQWRQAAEPKQALLERLAAIEGVYVPSFFQVTYRENGTLAAITPLREGYEIVRRRFLADLDAVSYPESRIVPFLKTVHDRVSVEVARGCTRGCRFCQAGYIYRPVRERTPERIFQIVEEALAETGYDEISLLSLSTGDYGCLGPLLKGLMDRYASRKKAVSLPSLRVGSLSPEMVQEIARVRKTGFTLAPEAGTERLRDVINKGISAPELLDNARAAYGAGWRLIKLYFMIGLPTEEMEDLSGIVELSREVKRQGKLSGGGEVNVSVSSFVPKPHTPFQWEPQISTAEVIEKQRFLRGELKKKKLNMKWQDANLSMLEGVFARGDRRLSEVLVAAHRLGCRFDGWWEHFDLCKWQEAFAAAGTDPSFYHRRRELDEVLPWDHLDCGVTREFLLAERARSFSCAATPDCRTAGCTGCGVCDFETIRLRVNDKVAFDAFAVTPPEDAPSPLAQRVRIRFSKLGRMRYLSHLEMLTLFTRAVGRSGVPIRFSQGFHPHPKFSFATALSVGIESFAEYLDLELDAGYGAERVKEALNRALPEGVEVLEAAEIPLRSPSLSTIMELVRYRITIPPPLCADLAGQVERFLALESAPLRREKKGKVVELDLRRELEELQAVGDTLELLVRRGKPLEFAAAVLGVPVEALAEAQVQKVEVLFTGGW